MKELFKEYQGGEEVEEEVSRPPKKKESLTFGELPKEQPRQHKQKKNDITKDIKKGGGIGL